MAAKQAAAAQQQAAERPGDGAENAEGTVEGPSLELPRRRCWANKRMPVGNATPSARPVSPATPRRPQQRASAREPTQFPKVSEANDQGAKDDWW